MFTLEFVNNEVPYIDLSSWAVQIHSDDKAIRDSAHDSLNEAFSLRFSESNYKFKVSINYDLKNIFWPSFNILIA